MTIINESLTAKGYTPAALVPAAFGTRRTIDEIVIHHWGERGQSHDGVVNFFVNGPGQTSAHYVVSAGRIDCLVSPADAAWHCPGKNASTIGIECRPEATEADYATVAELIRTLRAQYGNLPLSKHRDWYATACPGVWDLSRLDALAAGSTLNLQSESITPLEDDVSAEDVWTHNIEDPNEPGRFFPAYEWVRRANVKAGNAEALAGAALQAITGLLQTQLPDPNSEGRTYSLAEWIVYANVKAGGAQQAASQLSPEVIAEAVAKATSSGDAKAIAERLQIIVKES